MFLRIEVALLKDLRKAYSGGGGGGAGGAKRRADVKESPL